MEDDSKVKGMDQAPASNNSPRRIMTVPRKTLVAADNDRYITIDITTAAGTGAAGGVAATLTSRPDLGASFE